MANKQDVKQSAEAYAANVNKGNYAEAIKIDHANKDDIYSKLISSFIEDSKLDTDEDNFIINEIFVISIDIYLEHHLFFIS